MYSITHLSNAIASHSHRVSIWIFPFISASHSAMHLLWNLFTADVFKKTHFLLAQKQRNRKVYKLRT